MTPDDLELDEQGTIVTRPVLGWTLVPAAGMFVIARIRYAERPEELETGARSLQI